MEWTVSEYRTHAVESPEIAKLWELIPTLSSPNHGLEAEISIGSGSFVTVSSQHEVDETVSCILRHFGNPKQAEPVQRFADLAGFEAVGKVQVEGKNGSVLRWTDIPADGYRERFCSAVNEYNEPGYKSEFRMMIAGEIWKPVEDTGHDRQRPTLNGISRVWTTEFPAFYQDGVDVFARPDDIPADVGEVRFPVIRAEGKRDAHLPQLQVDVVHRPDYSYLEFFSGSGERALKRYAKQAEIELEMWNGPLGERWG